MKAFCRSFHDLLWLARSDEDLISVEALSVLSGTAVASAQDSTLNKVLSPTKGLQCKQSTRQSTPAHSISESKEESQLTETSFMRPLLRSSPRV